MSSWLQDAAKQGLEDKIIPQENSNGEDNLHTEVHETNREVCESDS